MTKIKQQKQVPSGSCFIRYEDEMNNLIHNKICN